MDKVQKQYDADISRAIQAMDVKRLDFLLRAEELYNHRGTARSTVNTQYDLVKQLDPKFYG